MSKKGNKRAARELRAATKAARDVLLANLGALRVELGISEPITTEAIVSIVGSRAEVVTAENKQAIADAYAHPFTSELEPGDVVWTVDEERHLCGVRVRANAGLICLSGATELCGRREHEGSVSIANGVVVLHAAGRSFDMTTCRPSSG